MTGADWLLDALAAEGVNLVFGNPGSTELPLIEALGRHDSVEYVLCLHEAAAVGMADGYAQASGKMAAVNVHVQPGAANALAGILNARRARVPLLVTVGQQVTALLPHAPFLGGEIRELVAPLAKGAWEPTSAAELARDFDAAVRCVLTPPYGPAVLSIPLDVQAGPAPAPYAAAPPPRAPAPDPRALDRAASLLRSARGPALLAGDEVVRAGAARELEAVAERLGAPVYGEPYGARMALASDHPLWRGPLPGFASEIRSVLEPHDVLLAVGMPVFRLFGVSPGSALGAHHRLIHLDVDPEEIGRSHDPAVGMTADPRAGLAGLASRLDGLAPTPVGPAPAAPERATDEEITPAVLADAIAEIVTRDDIVVDEALTAGRGLRRALVARDEGNWLAHRGSALGWGLPAAIGVAMARPGARVMVVHGDGSLLFGLPALWTAAARRVPLALVVADNRGYEILRAGMEGMTGSPEGPWPGLALDEPRLDLEALCRGFGAETRSAATPSELRSEMGRLWTRAADGPAVLVARVSGRTAPVGYPLR
jgi:benzoylformate decarboxylase